MSTEEDGVDDAGRTTQAPLITAPSDPEVDPDGESADAVVDNGSMSSSRARTGSSRSGADDRAGANGKATSDPAVKAANAADGGSDSSVPLPADTVGKSPAGKSPAGKPAAGKPAAGKPPADSSPDKVAEDGGSPAAKDDRKPSFTPSTPAPASPAPSSSSSSPSSSSAGASAAAARPAGATGHESSPYSGTSSYSGSGSGYSDRSYASAASTASPSGYQASAWQTSRDATMTAQSAPPAPAAGSAPSAPPSGSASSSSGPATGGFSAATSAVTGAAAGLASSVSSAWQNRGSNNTKQKQKPKPAVKGRKPAKRQAMLTLARLEPWSVMKFSFLASVVGFIILFVAVAVLYMVLSALGAFDSIQHLVTTLTAAKGTAGTNISHWTSASLILGWTAMLGAVNIVLITAISTVGSVIYNLIAKTVGGVEVTLRETE